MWERAEWDRRYMETWLTNKTAEVLSFLKLNNRCKQSRQKNWFKTLQSGSERLRSSSPTQPPSQRDGTASALTAGNLWGS